MSNLFYRLGTASEGKLFEEMRNYYYGIVINANIAAIYPNWIFSFIQKINKPFFIDPVTYVLTLDLESMKKNGVTKKSFEKLIKVYGSEISRIILEEKRPLLPTDFIDRGKWNRNFIEDFIRNVFSFQKRVGSISQTLVEILELTGKIVEPQINTPLFLISPYFYFESVTDPWYSISLYIAQKSRDFEKNHRIYPVICASKEVITDQNNIEKISLDYKGFDGYVLWISNLNEEKDEEKYLEGLGNLVKSLSTAKKPVINLYGEFFSLLLSKKYGIDYVRNICYGESKDAETPPAKGFLPKDRYYMTFIHSKIPEGKARAFFSFNPDLLCKCDACSKIRYKNTEDFFNKLTTLDFSRHFVITHYSEVKKSLKELQEELIENEKLCKKMKVQLEHLGISYRHLEKWISILEKL
jgi:hypothetical protein